MYNKIYYDNMYSWVKLKQPLSPPIIQFPYKKNYSLCVKIQVVKNSLM